MNNYKSYIKIILILIIPVISFVIGFIGLEDSLGGSKNDFNHHEKYIWNFYSNFNETFSNFGLNSEVRNLPTFYILSSLVITLGFELSDLRYFNLLSLILIILFIYKCFNLRFKKIKTETIVLFICCLLLSPTIRSLINYPYPFIWGLCFFVISIYYFLKFKFEKNNYFLNSIFCIINIAISSYFTPNFSVFILYFFYFFYSKFKFSKNLISILILSLLLSLPALSFLILQDFYIFNNDVFQVSVLEKFNFSNKFIIISSFLLIFLIPFINSNEIFISDVKKKIFNFKFYLLIFFSFFCIIIFDYKIGAGGGIFFQLSNILLKNNFLVFLSFILFLTISYIYNLINSNNISILIILILFNLQYTIYYKYFDPLIIFVYLFLINNINFNKDYLNLAAKKLYFFYIFFLLANIYKVQIKQFLII